MRTVSLSNTKVQKMINESFVPLKVPIDYGTKDFPLKWDAVQDWRRIYNLMGGPRTKGFTACVVVDPQTKLQLGSTGSAMVWELFDSIAYDPDKFAAMLEKAQQRLEKLQAIASDPGLGEIQKRIQTGLLKRKLKEEIRKEGAFHLPPRGFSIKNATKLFQLSGDL